MTTEAYTTLFDKLKKTAVAADYAPAETPLPPRTSKFGGKPHLPANFAWPYYEGADYLDEEIANRPLSFLAQFNLEEIADFDTDNMLPHTGMLYFFYELCTMKWGFDPKDQGCARVYYIEDTNNLSPVDFPADLAQDYRIPEFALKFSSQMNLPDYGEAAERHTDVEWDCYDEERIIYGCEMQDNTECSKLLGYANLVQGDMLFQCAEIAAGIYCGDVTEFTDEQRESLLAQSEAWTLLFQMSTVEKDGYELMFGDCGSIYFYIRKQDLKEKNFDNVWLILQCF